MLIGNNCYLVENMSNDESEYNRLGRKAEDCTKLDQRPEGLLLTVYSMLHTCIAC